MVVVQVMISDDYVDLCEKPLDIRHKAPSDLSLLVSTISRRGVNNSVAWPDCLHIYHYD